MNETLDFFDQNINILQNQVTELEDELEILQDKFIDYQFKTDVKIVFFASTIITYFLINLFL